MTFEETVQCKVFRFQGKFILQRLADQKLYNYIGKVGIWWVEKVHQAQKFETLESIKKEPALLKLGIAILWAQEVAIVPDGKYFILADENGNYYVDWKEGTLESDFTQDKSLAAKFLTEEQAREEAYRAFMRVKNDK